LAGETAAGASEVGAEFSSVVAQPLNAKNNGKAANKCTFENFMVLLLNIFLSSA
jgi:hypothetical protein